MAWKVELTAPARRQLSRLDRQTADRIARFLKDRIMPADDPRSLGKAMQGNLSGSWAYRVGDYRICARFRTTSLP